MSGWLPIPAWRGQDCYIIGGGPSLRQFDWQLLRGKHTIGCNDAFRLGPDICNVCVFGDLKFWEAYKLQLRMYGGMVVTNCPALYKASIPWLRCMKRKARGLFLDALGWNASTGAAAANLALLMGAQRVFLLGFDMAMGKDGPNWHDHQLQEVTPASYDRFRSQFAYVKRDLERLWPTREVINVTDGSRLDVFPKVSVDAHFGLGKENEHGAV